MTWLVALCASLAPFLPVPQLTTDHLRRARDWWLRGTLLAAGLWLTMAEPVFAPLAFWFSWRWRSHRELGPLVAWMAVAAGWFAVRAVPRATLEVVPLAWVAWGVVTVGILEWQRRRLNPEEGRSPSGTFGQRTMAAAYLALCLPFAPWGLWPALGLGLWITGPSWGALAALAVGLPVLAGSGLLLSATLGALAAALGAVWARSEHDYEHTLPGPLWRLLDVTPRGSSIDSLAVRGRALRLAWRQRREAGWGGEGPDTMARALFRWEAGYHTQLTKGDLHCCPAHLAWEYGLAGLATVALLVYRVGSGVTWGDPWSAAAVIAGVLSLTSFPLRTPPVGLVCLVIFARVAP